MQPSAHYDLSRTLSFRQREAMRTAGIIRKDPSAENQASCFVRIMLNNPSRSGRKRDGRKFTPKYDIPTNYEIKDLQVTAGDKMRFEVKHNGENRADPIVWNPKDRDAEFGGGFKEGEGSCAYWISTVWLDADMCPLLSRMTTRAK